MTILHLMAGLGEASGVANVARRFARVQTARGDEPILLAPIVKWNPIYFGLAFAWRAYRRARTADEIWVHCSWTFPVWFGAWLARRFGKRLVAVPEGSFDPQRLGNRAHWKKRLVVPLDRWVLRRAGEVLALCPDEQRWIAAFEPSAKVRRAAVPVFIGEKGDGACATTWDASSRALSCESVSDVGVKSDRPLRVLFLGRAEDPLKGVRYLEQAVAVLNDRVARSGEREIPAVELRIESNVLGAAKEAAWAWCDILCLPTLSDNFGLVVAEALEHGKFALTTDGAPAWCELRPEQGLYLVGFRAGDDATRVRLLVEALASRAAQSA